MAVLHTSGSYIILMLCIDLTSTDPFFNLAVDEYLLKNSMEEFLILGINDTCAVIGKHQSPHVETDTKFVYEHHIPVIRRISGGGTVFHDRGNLNFSFIFNSDEGKQVNFRKYTSPIISFLRSAGINAEFEGKNDLTLGGLKISGNAEHVLRNRVLHHGTLLYDSDLEMLNGAIRTKTEKYKTRAVASNRSSVTNIRAKIRKHQEDPGNTIDFKSLMKKWFLKNYPESKPAFLSADDNIKIMSLAEGKYRTWEWNYAYGPEYSFSNTFIFMNEPVTCTMFVRDGIIADCRFTDSHYIPSLAKKLIGQRHMVEDLMEIINNEKLVTEFDTFNLL